MGNLSYEKSKTTSTVKGQGKIVNLEPFYTHKAKDKIQCIKALAGRTHSNKEEIHSDIPIIQFHLSARVPF